MGRRTNLLLPDELVREVDRVAGPRNRSRFVAEAVRDRLRRERLREAWAGSFGAIRREEHPEWATPDRVEAWVRELRAEETTGEAGARAAGGAGARTTGARTAGESSARTDERGPGGAERAAGSGRRATAR